MNIKVKALEWREEEIPPTGEYLAYSPVGLYCIPRGRAAFSVRFRDKYEDGPYPTLGDSKAAAQADYERRILSAIEPSPDMREAVEALTFAREAIWKGCDAISATTKIDAALRSLTGAKP